MDEVSWIATIGGGSLLGDIDKLLEQKGNRAFSHGVCPGVGIGGHLTVVGCKSTQLIYLYQSG